jgi:hypothetical protein
MDAPRTPEREHAIINLAPQRRNLNGLRNNDVDRRIMRPINLTVAFDEVMEDYDG